MLVTSLLACTVKSDPPSEDRLCNGSADLCDRALDEAVFAVAHNAMSSLEDGFTAPNQNFGYERQVADGIRGFMLDIHDDDGVPSLCHASCGIGAQTLADGLARFSSLLDTYRDDVFVFILQDEIEAAPIVEVFEASGLLDRVIAKGPSEAQPAWPTLGELIDADTRLLVTHENAREDRPPWYHAAYDLAWDNDYSAQTVEDFGCEVLRGDPDNAIFLLNHFLTQGVGSEALATEANPEEVILEHVDRCEAETGDRVNWLAVDFYDVGGVLSVVDRLNARP